MKVLVTGGAGFLGSRLARSLLQRKLILGLPVTQLVLADLVGPASDLLAPPHVRSLVGPLIKHCPFIAEEEFDFIFHLAGAVSRDCEADFDLGMRSNLDTCRALLEALRIAGNCPRVVFASSVAVFGGDPGLPLPPVIRDNTLPTPQSSYGIQKFVCEQLITDYTRKGFIDGRSGRLMTVAIRPVPPNGAASGFLSAIVREPLNGIEVTCPVPSDMAVALASPANTVNALMTLAEADSDMLGGRTAINFPALTIRVGEILDALETVAGKAVRDRVRFQADTAITQIVGGWPSVFESARGTRLGLRPDPDMISIIRQYINEQISARVDA